MTATEPALPSTIGSITITRCDYVNHNDVEQPDAMPEFMIEGTVLVKGTPTAFVRKVAVELEGREADHEHVSGFDLDDLSYTGKGGSDDRCQVDEDLYNALYGCPAYREKALEYHGE